MIARKQLIFKATFYLIFLIPDFCLLNLRASTLAYHCEMILNISSTSTLSLTSHLAQDATGYI